MTDSKIDLSVEFALMAVFQTGASELRVVEHG